MSALIAIYFIIQFSLSNQWDFIESDPYYPHGSYVVLERNELINEKLISTITLEAFGKCKIVTDGIEYYFCRKRGRLASRKHIFNPERKYLKTVYHVPYNMGKYNYFTNNCKQFYHHDQ